MKNKDNLTEVEYSPFDTPIPGQSLTDEPGNYPWEHAPQFTDVDEVIGDLYDSLTKPNIARQLIAMLDAGVPVEAIVRVITFSGFMEGKYNPDVGFIITEPLMNLVSAIGIRAGVSNLKLSLEDLSSDDFIKDMADLKAASEEVKTIAKEITQDAPNQDKPAGLLAKPEGETTDGN
tara:strand:- start:251 stop:778 length:528 start_codon:yes stop_codon:yes gene_type:complete